MPNLTSRQEHSHDSSSQQPIASVHDLPSPALPSPKRSSGFAQAGDPSSAAAAADCAEAAPSAAKVGLPLRRWKRASRPTPPKQPLRLRRPGRRVEGMTIRKLAQKASYIRAVGNFIVFLGRIAF